MTRKERADEAAAILREARRARLFLEGIWPRWHRERGRALPAILSAGTCGRSSLLLRRVLRQAGAAAEVRHGWFQGAADSPQARRHAWVEAGPLLVDVTADQFGLAPVLVTATADARYRPGEDTAWPSARRAREIAVADAWEEWVAYSSSLP